MTHPHKTFDVPPGRWTDAHAKALRAWMKHNGLAGKKAAQVCGVSLATIRRARKGAHAKVSIATAKITDTLRTLPNFLCPTCGRALPQD